MTKASSCTLSLFLLLLPAMAWGGALDDYYLARFAPQVKSAQLSAVSAATAKVHRHGDHCRTMLIKSLKRDWDLLEPETQQILARQLARPALSGPKSFSSANFTIYYATSGSDAPPLYDGDQDGTPDWVERVAEAFEAVYRVEVTEMGYRAPYVSGRYPVYLRDLVDYYGWANTETVVPGTNGATSYIEIDNDFDPAVFYDPPAVSLQATAAHEFHHAIQFGYNPSFEAWYGEATATWIEDEVFDGANQLYRYLYSYLPSAHTISLNSNVGDGSEYGRWIFPRFLAERHGQLLLREILEDLGRRAPSLSDIRMIPLMDTALGKRGTAVDKELSLFAGALYSRDWRSHTDDIEEIPETAPLEQFTAYPATSANVSGGIFALPQYAFAYYRFVPSGSSPANLKLDLPGLSSNATAVAYRKGNDGLVTSHPLDRATGSISIPSFTVGQASEVMLAISSNGASAGVAFAFTAAETVPPPPFLSVAFTGSGGGSVNSVTPVNSGISSVTPENSGISCTTGASCPPAPFAENTVVTLVATPDSNSTFGGWSAPCVVTGNSCQVTLTSDATATATFSASPPVRIPGVASYDLISSAYAAAANGATIQARELTFPEFLLFNSPVSTSIVGGYDAAYGTRTGLSVISGSLRIRSGKVTVNGVAVR